MDMSPNEVAEWMRLLALMDDDEKAATIFTLKRCSAFAPDSEEYKACMDDFAQFLKSHSEKKAAAA